MQTNTSSLDTRYLITYDQVNQINYLDELKKEIKQILNTAKSSQSKTDTNHIFTKLESLIKEPTPQNLISFLRLTTKYDEQYSTAIIPQGTARSFINKFITDNKLPETLYVPFDPKSIYSETNRFGEFVVKEDARHEYLTNRESINLFEENLKKPTIPRQRQFTAKVPPKNPTNNNVASLIKDIPEKLHKLPKEEQTQIIQTANIPVASLNISDTAFRRDFNEVILVGRNPDDGEANVKANASELIRFLNWGNEVSPDEDEADLNKMLNMQTDRVNKSVIAKEIRNLNHKKPLKNSAVYENKALRVLCLNQKASKKISQKHFYLGVSKKGFGIRYTGQAEGLALVRYNKSTKSYMQVEIPTHQKENGQLVEESPYDQFVNLKDKDILIIPGVGKFYNNDSKELLLITPDTQEGYAHQIKNKSGKFINETQPNLVKIRSWFNIFKSSAWDIFKTLNPAAAIADRAGEAFGEFKRANAVRA